MRKDWIKCSLIEGCDIHDNLRKPINSKERNERINGKGEDQLYPYYGATGQVGFIDDYLTDGEYVLIGEDAAPFLDYSKDVAYQISGKTWVNNHAHILKSKFNNKFLLHYLNNFNYRDYVSGTTRLKLTQGRLKQIPLKVAPLPEQRAIVAKIEELFSDLDKGVTDIKNAQDQLKVYRQAVLKKAFEGELTKEWRRSNNCNEKWKKVKFDELIIESRNGFTGRPNYDKIGNPRIGITAITQSQSIKVNVFDHKHIVIPEKKINSYLLLEKDLMVCRQNGNKHFVGKFGVVDDTLSGLIFSDSLIRVRIDSEKINPRYAAYYCNGFIRKEIEKKCSTTAGNFSINSSSIKLLEVSYPIIDEQLQIVQEIESRISVCDKVDKSISESLKKAEALRQSILKKAFEGTLLSKEEIDICKAAKDYEPASILLEKIKKEKLS